MWLIRADYVLAHTDDATMEVTVFIFYLKDCCTVYCLSCTSWVNQIWQIYQLTACLSPPIVDFGFASTRGNTLRFSSAEEESQTVVKFQTSCWRSRGWWARMRVRGTSTFTIRSEADKRCCHRSVIDALKCLKNTFFEKLDVHSWLIINLFNYILMKLNYSYFFGAHLHVSHLTALPLALFSSSW